MFASCQRTSASTSTTRCSGRAASWLPITVHFRGITQAHRYSHTSKPSRCDLWKPGSQILTTPDRTHFRLSGWGRRLGGVGLFQALVQPCSGAGGHGGADHIDVLKDIVNNRDVGPFIKNIISPQLSAESTLAQEGRSQVYHVHERKHENGTGDVEAERLQDISRLLIDLVKSNPSQKQVVLVSLLAVLSLRSEQKPFTQRASPRELCPSSR